MGHTAFWVALLKIIWINILLSGDNAVVIAMACRGLAASPAGVGHDPRRRASPSSCASSSPPSSRRSMLLPWLKIVGGLRCSISRSSCWCRRRTRDEVEAVEHLWRAVRIVAIADIVMSLDNVIAIAAAAQGNVALLVIGLAISIPLIVAGAALIMALLDRFPILVWAGAALLGWIVGEVIVTDPVIHGYLEPRFGAEGFHYIELSAAFLGAVLVLAVGGMWRRSKQAAHAEKVRAAE